MDLFLSEFPKNFRGDAETFEFAREVSELVATVLFFRDDLDYIGTLNPSTSSTTERTTIDHEEVDNDDGDNETSSISEKEGTRFFIPQIFFLTHQFLIEHFINFCTICIISR